MKIFKLIFIFSLSSVLFANNNVEPVSKNDYPSEISEMSSVINVQKVETDTYTIIGDFKNAHQKVDRDIEDAYLDCLSALSNLLEIESKEITNKTFYNNKLTNVKSKKYPTPLEIGFVIKDRYPYMPIYGYTVYSYARQTQ